MDERGWGGGQGKVRGRDRAWGTTYSAKPGAWSSHVHRPPATLPDGTQAKRAAPLQPVTARASATHLQTRHANKQREKLTTPCNSSSPPPARLTRQGYFPHKLDFTFVAPPCNFQKCLQRGCMVWGRAGVDG